MIEDAVYVTCALFLGLFGFLIGGVIIGAMGWGTYLLYKIVMDIVSLFIPKNYRKGGKYESK